jgi:plasmid stabilization system protein ParE
MAHRLAPEVEEVLPDAWYGFFSESGSAEHADRRIDSIISNFLVIASYPWAGLRRDNDLRSGLRSFPASECVIIYRMEGEDVLILQVIPRHLDIPSNDLLRSRRSNETPFIP